MKLISFFVGSLLLASSSFAHDFSVGAIKIGHPYARPTVPGQNNTVAYLTLENTGAQADKLLAVSSPEAKEVEIHTMMMDGDVMKMRDVDNLAIAAKTKVEMKPGMGYHLMVDGLKQPLKVGSKITLQLQFEKAGKIDVSADIEAAPVK